MEDLSLTDPELVRKTVDRFRPSLGVPLPADLDGRLGVSHVAGRYHLTDQPFLAEGAQAIHRLGFKTLKLWLSRDLAGYTFNSRWNLPKDATLVQLLEHEYYRQALDLPFGTVVFEVESNCHGPSLQKGKSRTRADYAAEAQQMEEIAAYLLKTYGHQPRTFILQNWEGDWLLRGRDRELWKSKQTLPSDVPARIDTFIAWLGARQDGVAAARAKAGSTKARVFHAAEVNRVMDSLKGLPTVIADVLPHVAVDLISWSSYDGVSWKDPVPAWHGLEIIKHYARPSAAGIRNAIYIGEVGIPENLHTPEQIEQYWDNALAVFFAHDLPWIIVWEIYCNEPRKPSSEQRDFMAQELRGFWLIKPDGTLGVSGRLLTKLLEKAKR